MEVPINNSLAFSPDDRSIAGGLGWTTKGRVVVWDAENGREVRRFEGHDAYTGALTSSGISPGEQTVSSSPRGTGRRSGAVTRTGSFPTGSSARPSRPSTRRTRFVVTLRFLE